jgi:hypothetical protein
MTKNDHPNTVSLPFVAMVLAGVAGGVLGWLAGWLASPAVPLASVVRGAFAGSGGYLLGSIALMPWVARPLEQWMAIWPGALLSRLLATGIVAWLLYFRPPEGDGGFRVALVVSHVVSIFLDAAFLSRWSRSLDQNPVHES